MFRQRTLELLYVAKNFDKIFETNDFYNSNLNDYDDINNTGINNHSIKQQNKHNQMLTMKKSLSEFITIIKMYIRANADTDTDTNEEDTDFMNTLCDDILVAHNTLGKPTSNMYCGLRQHSQGRERSYNCQVPLDYNNDTPPPLGRPSLLRQYAQINTPSRPVLTRAHTSPSQREVINIVSANSYSDEDLAGLNGEEEE